MTHTSAIEVTPDFSVKAPNHRAHRLEAIDMVRGLVILIMAIDHVRDFFLFGAEQDPMKNPAITAGLFATRWITHFCAPVFVFGRPYRIEQVVRRHDRKTDEEACTARRRDWWLSYL